MKMIWISLLLPLALPGLVRCDEEKYRSTAAFRHPVAQAVFNLGYKLLDEWQSTSSATDNGVISPESIYSALALILPGLKGNSRTEVEKALGGLQLADIVGEHNEMNKAVFNNPEASYALYRANRLYVDNSVLLTKEYKANVIDELLNENSYKRVNFQENPNQAREKINKYVRHHTNKEITEFLSPNQVTTLTRMFLINAISLQAQWTVSFEYTEKRPFYVSPDTTSATTFMISDSIKCYPTYDENRKYMTVRVPFVDNELSMLVVMPREAGDFSAISQKDVEAALDELPLDQGSWLQECNLILPKFKVETDINNMIPMLKEMGITSVFDPDAVDLSNMLQKNTEDIYVSDFTHAATVEVDENGIKATAATGVGWSSRMAPPTVLINKPFLFIVRHEATGSTLFMGRVSKPQ